MYVYISMQLSLEVRKLLDEDLSSMLLITTEDADFPTNRMSIRRTPSVQSDPNDARKLLISLVLNLYFCVQSFADYRKYLVMRSVTTTIPGISWISVIIYCEILSIYKQSCLLTLN